MLTSQSINNKKWLENCGMLPLWQNDEMGTMYLLCCLPYLFLLCLQEPSELSLILGHCSKMCLPSTHSLLGTALFWELQPVLTGTKALR